VIRIPRWLFFLLLPVLFLGGCGASIRPLWTWTERGWIHPVEYSEIAHFPVLVRSASSVYSVAPLRNIPSGRIVVTSDFDETAINKDLNASIGSTADHRFFQVLERTSDRTSVTLELPTRHDSKLQGWYDIRNGEVIPQEMMRYGPGFAFFIIPMSTGCGVATVLIFSIFVRPRKRERSLPA
jgi:hypothetical protein